MTSQPDNGAPRDVDHAEVSRREEQSTKEVGPGSSTGKPILIAGYVVAALALAWAIFFSGFIM